MTQNTPSQESARFDPLEFWRQFYEANEQAWTKAMKNLTTTPEYAETQGKVLEISLATQKIMRDGMNAQLNSLNIPTRDDISRLGEILLAVEEKVDRLADRLDHLDGGFGALEKKLEERVSRIDKGVVGFDSVLEDHGRKLEDRVSRVIDKRIPALETSLDGHSKKLQDKLDRLEKRFASLDERLARRSEGGEAASQGQAAAASGRASRGVASPTGSKAAETESSEKTK